MKRSILYKQVRRCLLFLFCLALLSSCGQVPIPGSVDTSLPTMPPLYTRPERTASVPCQSHWSKGETATVRGLYRTSGDEAYLDLIGSESALERSSTARSGVSTPEGSSAPCWTRLFLRGGPAGAVVSWADPLYVEASGTIQPRDTGGLWEMQVRQSGELPFDPGAARAACRQAVQDRATELQALDWSLLAIPGYVTGTAGFHPQPEAFSQAQVLLLGTDERQPFLWAVVRGPDLPEVKPLVHRWVEVECLYDLDQARVVQLTATIRGERLE